MPRSEARVFTSIWKDGDFLSLTPDAQRLYMFLISQPELTYAGMMPLRPPRWAPKAAGLTLADIERDLKELEGTAYPPANPGEPAPGPGPLRRPFILSDSATGELFVRSLLRRDGAWKQPNLLKQAIDASEEIESPRILQALLAEVRRIPVDESPSEQVRTLIAGWVMDLEHRSPHPSAYPDPHPPDNPEDYPPEMGDGEGAPDPSADSRARARFPQSPLPVPPTPSSLPPPIDRKLGTRLPDDFRPTPEMTGWFQDNCPHVDGRTEHAKFCDYWRGKPGKDGRKLDWVATWRNWMRTAEQRAQPRQRGNPSQPASTADQRVAQAQALKAELAGQQTLETP